MRIISRTPLGECTLLRGNMGAPIEHYTRELLNLYIEKVVEARGKIASSHPNSLPAVDAHISKARAYAAGSTSITLRELRLEIDRFCETIKNLH